MATITEHLTLETVECYSCGMTFAIPASYKRNLMDSKKLFYCPAGHSQCYRRSEADILKEKLANKQREIDRQNAEISSLKDDIKIADHSRAASEKKMNALKKHVKNGVCPCCMRTFRNMQRHMSTKHPEYGS